MGYLMINTFLFLLVKRLDVLLDVCTSSVCTLAIVR
jgi:hypothetical protein